MVVPAVSIAGVFGLLCRQLAGRCGPGPESCPNPATSDSARPPSETQPTAGPFGPGLLVEKQEENTEIYWMNFFYCNDLAGIKTLPIKISVCIS